MYLRLENENPMQYKIKIGIFAVKFYTRKKYMVKKVPFPDRVLPGGGVPTCIIEKVGGIILGMDIILGLTPGVFN